MSIRSNVDFEFDVLNQLWISISFDFEKKFHRLKTAQDKNLFLLFWFHSLCVIIQPDCPYLTERYWFKAMAEQWIKSISRNTHSELIRAIAFLKMVHEKKISRKTIVKASEFKDKVKQLTLQIHGKTVEKMEKSFNNRITELNKTLSAQKATIADLIKEKEKRQKEDNERKKTKEKEGSIESVTVASLRTKLRELRKSFKSSAKETTESFKVKVAKLNLELKKDKEKLEVQSKRIDELLEVSQRNAKAAVISNKLRLTEPRVREIMIVDKQCGCTVGVVLSCDEDLFSHFDNETVPSYSIKDPHLISEGSIHDFYNTPEKYALKYLLDKRHGGMRLSYSYICRVMNNVALKLFNKTLMFYQTKHLSLCQLANKCAR